MLALCIHGQQSSRAYNMCCDVEHRYYIKCIPFTRVYSCIIIIYVIYSQDTVIDNIIAILYVSAKCYRLFIVCVEMLHFLYLFLSVLSILLNLLLCFLCLSLTPFIIFICGTIATKVCFVLIIYTVFNILNIVVRQPSSHMVLSFH